MVKSLISWVVAGLFLYAWYWTGYGWQYLQDIPRGDWAPTWMLFTILVILVNRRGGVAAVGGNVVETIISRVKATMAHVVGLLVALLVGLTAFSLHMGGFDVNEYIQAVVIVISNAVITSIFLGAIDDATQ